MPAAYRSRPVTVTAAQFGGGNHAEIQELAGEAGKILPGRNGLTILRREGQPDQPLREGWWVSVHGAGRVVAHAPEAFGWLFEPEGDGDGPG